VRWSDERFSHVEGVDSVTEDCAKNPITIMQEISGCWIPWKRFNHLLRRPLGSRMFGHVEVHNFTTIMSEYEKDVQDLESRRRHSEEID
jgi:hypothetical protein